MQKITFQNFDLLIEPDLTRSASYRVRVINSPAGQADGFVLLPFDFAQVAEFHRTLRQAKYAPVDTIRAWGERLFAALFVGEINIALRLSLDSTVQLDKGLRLRLQLADDPLLWALPWEYLYEPANRRFLAQSATTPIVRTVALPRVVTLAPLILPLKILVVIVNPGVQALSKSAEWEHIQASLAEAIQSEAMELHVLRTSKFAGLQQYFRQSAFHIVHFIGSEGFHTQADSDALSLLLRHQPLLRLVVLTGRPLRNRLSSLSLHQLTQHLLQQGIPAVAAAQFTQQSTALAFVGEFYSALMDHYPLDAAMGEARTAVAIQQDSVWGLPILGLVTADGELFQRPEDANPSFTDQTAMKSTLEQSKMDDAKADNHVKISSGGGTVVMGNVIVHGNLIGRDQVTGNLEQSESAASTATTSNIVTYDPATLSNQPLKWPPLWASPRAAETRGIREWLRMARLRFNPFGPEQAERDPELAKIYVYPEVFDRSLRDAQSAIVFGSSGSGKTACRFLLAEACRGRTPDGNVFPVICAIKSGAKGNPVDDAVQNFVMEQLARSLIAFFALNPSTFLCLERDSKFAVVACLYHTFRSIESAKAGIRLGGLADSDQARWFLLELDEFAPQLEDVTFSKGDWIEIISKARPNGFSRTYFIVDMVNVTLASLATDVAFLQELIHYVVSPDLKAVYLKALLPDLLQTELKIPEHVLTDRLLWTPDLLAQMLRSRVFDEDGFKKFFEELFDWGARPTNPARRLAEAADGSPRRLIRLGNRLLAAHVRQRRGEIELTDRELSNILDGQD